MQMHGGHTMAWRKGAVAAACALACLLAGLAGASQPAYAATIDELEAEYRVAYADYDQAVKAQKKNATKIRNTNVKIKKTQADIKAAEAEIARNEGLLADTAVTLYKNYPGTGDILDMVLQTQTVDEALRCLEGFSRIQRTYTDQLEAVRSQKAALDDKKAQLGDLREGLKDKREQLATEVKEKKVAAAEVLAALEDLDHSDGYLYHQRQGNGHNCGATAFIVGVNTLLHENRYTDNVGVWASSAFGRNSTYAIERKGRAWLSANGLGGVIEIEDIPGDIHTADKMRAELERGNVVITSSGPGSIWQYHDGATGPGTHKTGHYILFYYYKDGVYYANDSSGNAWRAGGATYTESQMQRWLDGRAKHYSVAMRKVQPESYLDEDDIAAIDELELPEPEELESGEWLEVQSAAE